MKTVPDPAPSGRRAGPSRKGTESATPRRSAPRRPAPQSSAPEVEAEAPQRAASESVRAAPVAQLQALAEPKRLWIVDRLRDGEQCVCELTDALDAGQSLLSHHLRVLKEAGLVTDRREGRWSYYSLVPETLATVERWLARVRADTVTSSDPSCAC